jgi:hypothetical protein
MVMQAGCASLPKRRTTRRDSSDRMAWSTCHAEGRCVRKMEPIVGGGVCAWFGYTEVEPIVSWSGARQFVEWEWRR